MNWRDFHDTYPATVTYLMAVAVLMALVNLFQSVGLIG